MTAAILAGLFLFAAPAQGAEIVRDLGGEQAGCPMKAIYEPAVLRVDSAAAVAVLAGDPKAGIAERGLMGLGVTRNPKTGRDVSVLYSLGPSCDPYFLFVSTGPKGLVKTEVPGEDLSMVQPFKFEVMQTFDLYLPIVRLLTWTAKGPSENGAVSYKVSQKTITMADVPVYEEPASAKPRARTGVGKLGVFSVYFPKAGPDGKQHRAFLSVANGQSGFVILKDGILDGVAFKGD